MLHCKYEFDEVEDTDIQKKDVRKRYKKDKFRGGRNPNPVIQTIEMFSSCSPKFYTRQFEAATESADSAVRNNLLLMVLCNFLVC